MSAGTFALRLKELRTAAGITQPELAEKAGMSKGGIADLEQGRREPAWGTVIALAAALGVKTDEFLKPASEATTAAPRGRPTHSASHGEPEDVAGAVEAAPGRKPAKGKAKKGK